MHLAVYLPLLAPLLAAGSAGWLAERMAPRWATWLLATAAVVLAVAGGVALTALAATAIAQLPPVAALGHWSVAVLRREDPASLDLALVASAAALAALVAAVRTLCLRIRALVAAARTARCLPGARQLVVLDDPTPDAYAVPGRPGRIVISTGMYDALDPGERRVLFAHERAHLTCRHHLFVAAAQLAAATNPLLRPLAAAVGYSTERWADERAAQATGDRPLTARTVGKAALLSTHHPRATALAVTGDSPRHRGLRRTGPVPRRVAALLSPPVTPHPVLTVLILLVLTIAAAAAVEAARDLDILFDLAHVATVR